METVSIRLNRVAACEKSPESLKNATEYPSMKVFTENVMNQIFYSWLFHTAIRDFYTHWALVKDRWRTGTNGATADTFSESIYYAFSFLVAMSRCEVRTNNCPSVIASIDSMVLHWSSEFGKGMEKRERESASVSISCTIVWPPSTGWLATFSISDQ